MTLLAQQNRVLKHIKYELRHRAWLERNLAGTAQHTRSLQRIEHLLEQYHSLAKKESEPKPALQCSLGRSRIRTRTGRPRHVYANINVACLDILAIS